MYEWVISTIATIATVISSVAVFAYWLGGKIAGFEERFRHIDERFKEIDRRFEEIDERFEEIDRRFREIDRRFEEIDKRFKELEERFDERFRQMERRLYEIDKRLSRLEDKFDRLAKAIPSYVESVYVTLIDFMSFKGLFTPEERKYLIAELSRITKAHTVTLNPLKPEEAKFILQVLKELEEKDPLEFDIRKLDKIIEIARRWLWEDGHPDAARMIFLAYALKAIVKQEQEKRREEMERRLFEKARRIAEEEKCKQKQGEQR